MDGVEMSVINYQQTSENNLQLAKRRAEREAADFKQKALKCAFSHLTLLVLKVLLIPPTALSASSNACEAASIAHQAACSSARPRTLLARAKAHDVSLTAELVFIESHDHSRCT